MAKSKKIRTILLIVIPLLLVAAYLFQRHFLSGNNLPDENKPQASAARGSRVIPVRVYVAEPVVIDENIDAVGSLKSNEEVVVSSEVQGKVNKILFTEGARVSKGDILVKVNDDDLQAQLKRYQFQEQTLKENVERQRILFDREAISQQAYDEVVTQYNMLLAEIELINVRIDRTEIRAPFSGTIGIKSISEGSYLQSGTAIAWLVDYNTIKVEFSIPEKYIDLDLIGKPVTFTTPGSDKVRKATVYAMEPRVDEQTRTIILRARYNNASGELRPGMSTVVSIPVTQAHRTLMVPTESIVPSIDGTGIWMVRNGRPELVTVQTGLRSASSVEILEGMVAGDSVITTGLMQLRPGSQIKVTD